MAATASPYIYWFEQLSMAHLPQVGGKNASLGEMVSQLTAAGVEVPGGFATSAQAFLDFLQQANLGQRIADRMAPVDVEDVSALQQVGSEIRQWIESTPLLPALEDEVRRAWQQLQSGERFSVAVRSSATAEDLPDASFAGQQETYLNVQGIDQVLEAIKRVYASLYTDRAIAYRVHHGFDHSGVSISAGVQRMVRSDKGTSGVLFTLDTESGFRDVVFITASYGLGEMVVQGGVNPDEFYLHKRALREGYFPVLRRNRGSKAKRMVFGEGTALVNTVVTETVPEAEQNQFCLSDDDLKTLGNLALIIEDHYGRPMDIEWAKENDSGKIFIVQARPETVRSGDEALMIERFQLEERSKVLAEGRSIGQRLGQGKACVIQSLADMDTMPEGAVLVTDMTDPDWEPVMKRAAAIVTNRGGRTCHAAIIARELGIPAVVGTGNGTEMITAGKDVTVSCAEGDTGFVYDGLLKYQRQTANVGAMPAIPFKMMMNVANPDGAFAFQRLPNEGVGLARLEFIISQMIGIHPQALLDFDSLEEGSLKSAIAKRTAAYPSPVDYYVDRLAEGMSTLAAAFYPKPVIVRLSDFKSNEYAHLLGGDAYEPQEENPMLGFRGASRYVSSRFGRVLNWNVAL